MNLTTGKGLLHEPAFLRLALALILTSLNAFKPLHIDDSTYYQIAAHIAEHPADPYGFAMMEWNGPVPANHVLAPPVIPYWWAAGIRLFGMHPWAWKLWLFPFCFLFVMALDALLCRFASAVAGPLLIMTVLSPVFVPSLNLMLDIPALALGLSAVALFLAPASSPRGGSQR